MVHKKGKTVKFKYFAALDEYALYQTKHTSKLG